MKIKAVLSTLFLSVLLCTGFLAHAQRAFNDTMLVFQVNPGFLCNNEIIGLMGSSFLLPNATFKQLAPMPISMAKKLGVPRATKTASGPITLTHQGDCYRFGCKQGTGCQGCQLVWYDRNGDGKVQPKRELRCVCAQGDQCKIKVEKVNCD